MAKYLRGDEPNDKTKSDSVTLPGWSWGRGKCPPPATRVANGHGAHGDDDLAAMNEAGKRVLDEAMK